MRFTIRPLEDADQAWVLPLIAEHWGSTQIVTRGVLYDVAGMPGYAAEMGAEHGADCAGLITYRITGDECEIMSLNSLREGIGVGGALIEAVRERARAAGCRRLWLITTNDNLHALRFYQRHGFTIAAIHCNALEVSRRLKPEIPLIGSDGIPLRDEIELEMFL